MDLLLGVGAVLGSTEQHSVYLLLALMGVVVALMQAVALPV